MIEMLLSWLLLQYYSNGTWCGWSCYLTGQLGNQTTNPSNISNATSPFSAMNNAVTNALPWFWPIVLFVLYLVLVLAYDDSPTQGKLMGISLLVLIITVFMVLTGLLADAALEVVLFALAYFLSWVFKL